MHARIVTKSLVLWGIVSSALAQNPANPPNSASSPSANGWQASSPNSASNSSYQAGTGQPQHAGSTHPSGNQPASASSRPTRAQFTEGAGKLPTDQGQIWREYDITPYTMRIQTTKHPEQAVVDWILRETGYETWHSKPVALLSADKRVLRVYHTPQMQAIVADIVDRFVNTQADNHGFGLRIVTIHNPNWRIRAMSMLTPISVQSPGVQGWLLAKEDAALLQAKLRERSDYREHSAPNQLINNGQALAISSLRPRNYTRGIIRTANSWPGYQLENGRVDEGFSLEFTPLLSLDTQTVDGVVKLRLTQVEKMLPIQLEAPSSLSPNQQVKVEVPQLSMLQIHERFRWPTNQTLLLSLGVVATPGPAKTNSWTANLPIPKSAPRADALLFVESRGNGNPGGNPGAPPAVTVGPTASRSQQTFHGRY